MQVENVASEKEADTQFYGRDETYFDWIPSGLFDPRKPDEKTDLLIPCGLGHEAPAAAAEYGSAKGCDVASLELVCLVLISKLAYNAIWITLTNIIGDF